MTKHTMHNVKTFKLCPNESPPGLESFPYKLSTNCKVPRYNPIEKLILLRKRISIAYSLLLHHLYAESVYIDQFRKTDWLFSIKFSKILVANL